MDDRQNHVSHQGSKIFSNNTSHDKIDDAMIWLDPIWQFIFGEFKSIAQCFSQKKALGWKLQDIETHDITGKKTS